MSSKHVSRRLLFEECQLKPTKEDKGVELSIPIKLYDNGQIYVAGSPAMALDNEGQICNVAMILIGIIKVAIETRNDRIAFKKKKAA